MIYALSIIEDRHYLKKIYSHTNSYKNKNYSHVLPGSKRFLA